LITIIGRFVASAIVSAPWHRAASFSPSSPYSGTI